MSNPQRQLKRSKKVDSLLGSGGKSKPSATAPKTTKTPPPLPPPKPFNAQDLKNLATLADQYRDEALKAGNDLGQAFGKVGTVEDMIKLKGPEKKKVAEAVQNALKPVPALVGKYDTLNAKLNDLTNPAKYTLNGVTQPDIEKLRQRLMGERGAVRRGLPDGVSSSLGGDWPKTLSDQMIPFLNPNDPTALQNAKNDTQSVANAGGQLKQTVEKYQVWSMGRAASFFDARRAGAAMSEQDTAAAAKANDILAEKGRAILNNGGTYKDVKALMAHSGLTEEWWPPQLVESVQAWRKTQRALNDERVSELAEKQKKGEYSIESLSAANEYLGSNFELDGTMREISKDDGVMKAVDGWIGSITSGLSGIEGAMEFIKNPVEMIGKLKDGEAIEISEFLEKSLKTLQGGLKAAISGMKIAQNLGSDPVQELMKKVVPGLSLAAAGIDLLDACKELAKHAKVLDKTRSEKNQALGLFAEDGVDEATVNAIRNELSARKTQVAKDSVKVGTGILDTGGAGASTFGGAHGQAAGAAITVVSSAIKLGAKIIFSSIDWSKAQKAQDTIKQAQGGNMVAQIQVFEDSGFYAKMYLAILCRDNQAMAKKFVIDRGIEEGDLDNVMGLKILRETMLESAGQINDTEVEGGLAKYMAGGLGTVLGKGGDLVKKGATGLGNALRSTVTESYDTGWSADPAHLKLDPAAWTQLKAAATDAGLINDASGVTKVLEKHKQALADADAACPDPNSTKPSDSQDPTGDKAKKLKAGTVATREIASVLGSFSPQAYDGIKQIPHAAMADALHKLLVLANTTEQKYYKAMETIGGFDFKWQPAAKITGIASGQWDTLWTEGKTKAALPDGDAGVSAALKEEETTQQQWDKLKTAPQDQGPAKRKHILIHMGTIEKVKSAMNACLSLPEVGQQTGLQAQIDALFLLLDARERELDEYLAGEKDGVPTSWTTAPSLTFTAGQYAGSWQKLWDAALKDGFCNPKNPDPGVAPKLAIFDKSVATVNKGGKGQDLLKAYSTVMTDAGAVKEASLTFTRKHRYSAEQLKNGALQMGEKSVELAKSLKANKPVVNFTPATTFDSKGWSETYKAALKVDAVLKSGTAQNVLKKVLSEHEKAKVKYEGTTDAKETRKLAADYLGMLHRSIDTIGMVQGLKGYGEHPNMGPYLKQLGTTVEGLITADLEKDADGSGVANFKLAAPTDLATESWSKNKNKAIDDGVLIDKKTGIKERIKAFNDADGDFKKSPNDDKVKQKQIVAANDLVGKLALARDGSKNPVWVTYCADLIKTVNSARAA